MKKNSWHAKIYLKNNKGWEYDEEGYGKTIEGTLPEDSCDYFGWWLKHIWGYFTAWALFLVIAVVLLSLLAAYVYGWYLIIAGQITIVGSEGIIVTKQFNGELHKHLIMCSLLIWAALNLVGIVVSIGATVAYIKDRTAAYHFKKFFTAKIKRKPFCFKINWQD